MALSFNEKAVALTLLDKSHFIRRAEVVFLRALIYIYAIDAILR